MFIFLCLNPFDKKWYKSFTKANEHKPKTFLCYISECITYIVLEKRTFCDIL